MTADMKHFQQWKITIIYQFKVIFKIVNNI